VLLEDRQLPGLLHCLPFEMHPNDCGVVHSGMYIVVVYLFFYWYLAFFIVEGKGNFGSEKLFLLFNRHIY
jgi:hypothetical protein